TALADLITAIHAGQTTMRDMVSTPTFRVGPPFDEALLPMPERFIGREAELAWVKRRLRQGGATSITAVNGMGGIGKTTLAAVAVHELKWEGRFGQGIVVLNCAEKRDAADCEMLLHDILARFDPQINLPVRADLAALRDLVGERLTGRDALIVLDNVEPQFAIGSLVAPLREAGLTLLLTARQFLPEAAVPPPARLPLGLLSTADALTLFLQSAGRSTAHDYEGLTAADFDAAKRIVTALERHTLGVKLAGAYAATLGRTLAGVADEIERDLFDIPEDETPRKVEAVIARSVEALPPDGRRLFAALAGFGTKEFGRKAALALAEALYLPDPRATLDLLARRALLEAYVDVSLPEDADCERVRLHPLIQLFTQNLFSSAQTLDAARAYTARRAIALWYSDYCERSDSELVVDEENLISAFLSAVTTLRDDDVAVKIAVYM
ncbi:MAG: NB-ARC domain-containing protein, partial [Ktedonobacterales bacterium]